LCRPTAKASRKPFDFFNRYDRDTAPKTWQVLRSELMLHAWMENGARKGRRMLENHRDGFFCGRRRTGALGAWRH